MKKQCCWLIAVLILCILTGCSCKHEWKDADCQMPKTCTLCGETEGEPVAHSWADATCEQAKACRLCGQSEGEPTDHSWMDATCEQAKTCNFCGITEGEALGHNYDVWQVANDDVWQRTCENCGAMQNIVSYFEALMEGEWELYKMSDGHGWVEELPKMRLVITSDHTIIWESESEILQGTWECDKIFTQGVKAAQLCLYQFGDNVTSGNCFDDGTLTISSWNSYAQYRFQKVVQ